MKRPRRHGGFTLLEVMIALAIAALIMAVGAPSFVRATRKEGLRKGVSDLVEGCSEARTQAILKGIPVDLVIEAGERRISVKVVELEEDDVWAASASKSQASDAGEKQIKPFSRIWPEQVGFKHIWVKFVDMIEAAEATVRFYPNGTSDEFTAILASSEGQTKVSLDVVTGLADSEPFR